MEKSACETSFAASFGLVPLVDTYYLYLYRWTGSLPAKSHVQVENIMVLTKNQNIIIV